MIFRSSWADRDIFLWAVRHTGKKTKLVIRGCGITVMEMALIQARQVVELKNGVRTPLEDTGFRSRNKRHDW